MNPTEVTGEFYLKMKKIITSRKHLVAGKGRKLFLEQPCRGCGSGDHSLLGISDTTSDISPLEYRCEVIDHHSLYPGNDQDEIHIFFRLRADAYAQSCNFDMDQAVDRVRVLRHEALNNIKEAGYFDTFMNRVRGICIEREFLLMGR